MLFFIFLMARCVSVRRKSSYKCHHWLNRVLCSISNNLRVQKLNKRNTRMLVRYSVLTWRLASMCYSHSLEGEIIQLGRHCCWNLQFQVVLIVRKERNYRINQEKVQRSSLCCFSREYVCITYCLTIVRGGVITWVEC